MKYNKIVILLGTSQTDKQTQTGRCVRLSIRQFCNNNCVTL